LLGQWILFVEKGGKTMLKTNGGSGIFARFLAVFLCALLAGAMLLSGAGAGRAYAGMAPKAAGGTPQQGDIVYFGSYPQSWSATQAAREAVLQEESDAPTESGVSLGTLATEGDYTYSIGYFREGATYTQGAIITRYNGFGGAVVIPDTLGGYPVLQISEYDGYWGAFEGKT
jgi:hypothetical protein